LRPAVIASDWERRAKKSWATRRDGIRNSKDRLARTGADSRDRPVVAKRLAIEMLAKGFADIAIVDSAQGGKGVYAI
jgi:hypothetical protein